MQIIELLEIYWGDFMGLILSLISYFVLYEFDPLKLKENCGKYAFIIYLISVYIIYFLIIILKYLISNRKIKISHSSEMYDEKFDSLVDGKKFYGFLDIEIPNNWVITDCYITLERKTPIYYEDKVLIREDFSEWFSKNVKSEYKMLHWRSPSSNQDRTKINIGENSNRETFSVGKIITGKFGNTEINTFSFDVQQKNPGEIDFNHLGLYEFTIIFHWKRFGRNMISKKIDGYIYSRSTSGIREIWAGVGNYKDDKRVPTPINNESENGQKK
ncbi:MAG: hypothetical protein AB2L18_01545 [Anaerolineaceae bacterium]